MDMWKIQEKYKKIIKNEKNLCDFKKQAGRSCVIVYPNTYFVGMSNLGFQTIYSVINSHPDFTCDRAFLPEEEEELFYKHGPKKLSSLETFKPLSDFDIIVFSVSYEVDFLNILKILHYAGIPLRAGERDSSHPVVLAGGAAVTLNPAPMAQFMDAFIIGEGEDITGKLLDIYSCGDGKNGFLKQLSKIDCCYVPKYYDKNKKITRNYIKNLDFGTHSAFLTNLTEFKNTFLVEMTRGCPYRCGFCVVGGCLGPYRHRNMDVIKEQINFSKKFTDRVGLISASISDYPQLEELIDLLEKTNSKISFSSMRIDKADERILKILLKSEQKTATFAPETVSGKLKKIINKDITEQDIYNSADLCLKHNIKNFKLYFMLGLPSEDEDDVMNIAEFLKHLSSYIYEKDRSSKIKASISRFIPKPFTPLQWEKFEDGKIYAHKIELIKSRLKQLKNLQINFESGKTSFVSNLLSRGSSGLADILEKCFLSANYAEFANNAQGLDYNAKYKGTFNEILPWDFMQSEKTKEGLWKTRENLFKPR